jgi:hypothetical protein
VSRPTLEVAQILRHFGASFLALFGETLSRAQRRVFALLQCCRTEALGGHVERCDCCGHERVAYNSCRSRHCPKCQSLARAEWLDARRAEALDCPYFHVVFTLPAEIAAIAYQNKRLVYTLLFRATAETLLSIAADPKRLGADIGFIAVLHTWGQNLLHHPHLHCLVPGGGLAFDRSRWVACRQDFFVHVRVLSRRFRHLFLKGLQAAYEAGQLKFYTHLTALKDPAAFARYLAPLRKTEWVVYAKKPLGGPEQVIDYLGHYTHRVAISNHRLIDMNEEQVRFHYKDYRDHDRQKVMALAPHEFIHRFLLHVLPDGFQRIRYYGFLANRHRTENLALCRRLLGTPPPPPTDQTSLDYRERFEQLTGQSLITCPICHRGRMATCRTVLPAARAPPMTPSL